MNEMNILACYLLIGLAVSVFNAFFVLKPFYKWINRNIKEDFYDETKSPAFDFDVINGKYGVLLNLFFGFLPFILIGFVLSAFLTSHYVYLYGLVIIGSMFLVLFILCHRDHVFSQPNFNDKTIEKPSFSDIFILTLKGRVYSHPNFSAENIEKIHFTENKYSFVFSMIISMFLTVALTLSGITNLIETGEVKYLIWCIVTFVFILMILFVDKVDNLVPINLHKRLNFLSFELSLVIIVSIMGRML